MHPVFRLSKLPSRTGPTPPSGCCSGEHITRPPVIMSRMPGAFAVRCSFCRVPCPRSTPQVVLDRYLLDQNERRLCRAHERSMPLHGGLGEPGAIATNHFNHLVSTKFRLYHFSVPVPVTLPCRWCFKASCPAFPASRPSDRAVENKWGPQKTFFLRSFLTCHLLSLSR
jgi:hypothetical protein